jgi:hypothetical protein
MLIVVLRLRPSYRQLRTALPPVPLLDPSDALDVIVAAPHRGPPVSSVAVSGVVSGPPPVQRGPVLFHVGVAAVGPGVSV